jgi:hypothetical protein
MYKIVDKIDSNEIYLNDFLFIEGNVPYTFIEFVYGLDYGSKQKDKISSIKNVNQETKAQIVDMLIRLNIDENTKEAIRNFDFDINLMSKGDSMDLHNEMGQRSPFEVLFWLVKTNEFTGRDFLMQKGEKSDKVKPRNGLFCFINTLSSSAYHGVSRLETDTSIVSITGGLGRKHGTRANK